MQFSDQSNEVVPSRMPTGETRSGELDRLVDAVADRARAVRLLDPDDWSLDTLPRRAVLLAIGLPPGQSGALISELTRAGATEVCLVLRAPTVPAQGEHLQAHARAMGVTLHWLAADLSWSALNERLTQRFGDADRLPIAQDDELADLAQTIATLTGGLVTIEDTASRVLAYSRSSDDVDELRRLSILGRSGPAAYLRLLAEWGVYDRLATSEDVVEIDEHPASGVRRRLAVGIFAGGRQWGTIWVQQGREPFGPHAAPALLGAARLAADQLAGRRRRTTQVTAAQAGLTGVLAGDRVALAALGASITRRPCAVAVFSVDIAPAVQDIASGSAREPAPGRAEHISALHDLNAVVGLHAAAFRRDALAGITADTVTVVLPAVEDLTTAVRAVRQTLAAARAHLDRPVRCGIGELSTSMASTVALTHAVRTARHALEEAGRLDDDASDEPLTYDAARPALAVRAAVQALGQQPELIAPALRRLVESDPVAARTLGCYLDSGSQVAEVARANQVHVTTVRYRIRKAVELLALDLTDPDSRLACQLGLRALVQYPSQRA